MEFKITNKGVLIRVYASEKEKEVVIPNNVTNIRKNAFSQCKHVSKVVIPNSVDVIEEEVFSGSKIESIVIPSSVKRIGKGAFRDCKTLCSVEIESDLQVLESELFEGCESLKNIKIPQTVIAIGENVFKNCLSLENITIPKSTVKIGESVFYNCSKLEDVAIEGDITVIPYQMFYLCYSLKKIRIPNTVKKIEENAFCYCPIMTINIPDSVEYIGNGAFSSCNMLKSVNLPSKIKSIPTGCFCWCSNLKEIVLPDGVENIGDSAFSTSGLIKIILPNTLKNIGKFAFSNSHLEEVTLPESLEQLGNFAFNYCKELKEVKNLSHIEAIYEGTFQYCKKLEKITLPNSLEIIGKQAFFGCSKLSGIVLPDTLKKVEEQAFYSCGELNDVVISENSNLTSIGRHAFSDCSSLSKINLPNGIKSLEIGSFSGSGIKEMKIPESVKYISTNVFSLCKNLKRLVIPSTVKMIFKQEALECDEIVVEDLCLLNQEGFSDYLKNAYCYYNESTDGIILSKEQKDFDGYEIVENYMDKRYGGWFSVPLMLLASIVLKQDGIKKLNRLDLILEEILKKLVTKDNYKEVGRSLRNNKEFNTLISVLFENYFDYSAYVSERELRYDLFKLCYSLGGFSSEIKERQRACNFILNAYEKGLLSMEVTHGILESLAFREYNKDWADFFLDKRNFYELIKFELTGQSGYIARICNSFEEIKEYGRSNRGDQHYRKVTVEMCREYLSKVNFEGVDESNIDISETISSYTHRQESFDKAVEIRKKYLELEEIGEIQAHIVDDINETLKKLSEISNDVFTCEFLSKYDPKNYVLGKYCTCCAHIEGAGYGIMKASILHPDCQNLVIRDKNGQIIAKSTLYINRQQGYGVFNNVEINNNIKDSQAKDLMYERYIEAIDAFARAYNKENASKPIKQINVGMSFNDLGKQLVENGSESDILLQGINFSSFGGYNGDWQKEQYVVWTNDELNKRKI